MVFSQLIGMWGKTGVNVFVLISGWFMCTSELSVKRFLKVFLEAKFYAVLAFVALALGGYEVLSGKQIFMLAFGLIRDVNVSFTGSFLAFYLFMIFVIKVYHIFGEKGRTFNYSYNVILNTCHKRKNIV